MPNENIASVSRWPRRGGANHISIANCTPLFVNIWQMSVLHMLGGKQKPPSKSGGVEAVTLSAENVL